MNAGNYWQETSGNSDLLQFKSSSNDYSLPTKMNQVRPSHQTPTEVVASNLNFCADLEFGPAAAAAALIHHPKVATANLSSRPSRQDPMSHRIIEKRRRDRMNNCLADLSRLIPSEYLKKGRGRVEKTEIIEMAIKHMKHLQYQNHYRLGFQECMTESLRFMVESEGYFAKDALCMRLMDHLRQQCDSMCESKEAMMGGPEMDVDGLHQKQPKVEMCESFGDFQMDATESQQSFISGFGESEQHMQENNAYKYKNDIKLRFCRERSKKCHGKAAINIQRIQTNKISKKVDKRDAVDTEEKPGNQSIVVSSSMCLQNTPEESEDFPQDKGKIYVPCFVLHAEGTFYIPLSLDLETLKPFLQHHDDLMHVSKDLILHPVAINVNFNGNYGKG